MNTISHEFSRVDLAGQAPNEICSLCAAAGVLHGPTQTRIAYCSHGLRGAYAAMGRPWRVITGIEHHHFRDLVTRGLTAGELRIELERDLARILAEQQAPGETKH